MSALADWLDPAGCPAERPPTTSMSPRTRELHDSIDDNIRGSGAGYLHPSSPTLMLDVLGSDNVISWQEGKASFLFMGEGCWSTLPQLYARYGTRSGSDLISRVAQLEGARCVVLADCGMQATALTFDALMSPGSHAITMRQVYNKSRSYLELLASRIGGSVTVVDDGDHAALRAAIRPNTALIFAETFTNPLMRAQDPEELVAIVASAKSDGTKGLRLVIDNTIATPWAFERPLLAMGVDVVVASGTKALAGQDRDMWGYVATNNADIGNEVMDLVALRGGNLDWRRAHVIAADLDAAAELHARRCASAERIARFVSQHPRASDVFHPSLADHPDAAVVAKHYRRRGSIVSFRVDGADEDQTRHLADVLATTVVVRYALSFDGLATKVNHHKTVSEYFTPPDRLKHNGLDRLIRLAVGTEDPDDLIAALNWMLHHGASIDRDDIASWQQQRARQLASS